MVCGGEKRVKKVIKFLNFFVDSQPPDVTHNTAQSRRLTAADRVNRYNQSRQSSASDDSMGKLSFFKPFY